MLDMSMMGVGVGFDALGAEKSEIKKHRKDKNHIFKIPDTHK